MRPKYFYIQSYPEGNIYYQFRYIAPAENDKIYHGLKLIIPSNGKPWQELIHLTEKQYRDFHNTTAFCEQSIFNSIQETFTSSSRVELYNHFYELFNEHYELKKEALLKVRKLQLRPYEYEARLHQEHIDNGAFDKLNTAMKVKSEVQLKNNLSEMDIFEEAEHTAIYDYTIDLTKAINNGSHLS